MGGSVPKATPPPFRTVADIQAFIADILAFIESFILALHSLNIKYFNIFQQNVKIYVQRNVKTYNQVYGTHEKNTTTAPYRF